MHTKRLNRLAAEQKNRNQDLLATNPFVGQCFESKVLPFTLDLTKQSLDASEDVALSSLGKKAATVAIKSLISLAKENDIDHLGGGLELIPSLLMTLAAVDYDKRHFTIEHAHTSIGYYAALAALGFLDENRVIDGFRRSLDIPGHVSWVPGGTELNGGRLGVMVPVAVGQALGLKASKGSGCFVVCHCGDAGWISGQALNGFTAASLHQAPVMFVMKRNGIQLSGTTAQIMNKDPRPIISSLGIQIIEIASLLDRGALFGAYREGYQLAQAGQPSLIYPTGYRSTPTAKVTVRSFGEQYEITHETEQFAAKHKVSLETEIWVPGSLMSFRDAHAMLECLFLVNNLPGGEGHHDGGMKGRDAQSVLSNPMLQFTTAEKSALKRLKDEKPRIVVTSARPPKGAPNLPLHTEDLAKITLPGPDKWISARAGSEAAYAAIAKKYPQNCFFVSCDLDPSTKLGKAASLVPKNHCFQMSIQEQAAALLTNGLAFSSRDPRLNVFATFTAFIEGIAREGFELWRYQRNLNGVNEGLNVIMHLSHVGACTGRDHFSGWSLDWVNFGLGYLPFLRRFYSPADARSAFLAVRDAAAAFGGHIIAIPRDNLPVLTKQGTTDPLWNVDDEWTAVTPFRKYPGADTAILSLGAPSFVAGQAVEMAAAKGTGADAYVVNGFPIPEAFLDELSERYRRILTIEDGLIGTPEAGLRGFAAYLATQLGGSGVEMEHFGIADPGTAPSEHFLPVWKHFGMTDAAIASSLLGNRG